MDKKYRIVEYMGEFKIQRYLTAYERLFRSDIKQWFNLDCYGYVSNIRNPTKIYYSLNEAKEKLKEIKKGIIIHESD